MKTRLHLTLSLRQKQNKKGSYYVHDSTEAFSLFLLQLNFDIFIGPFSPFVFLLQKDFDIFCVLLFDVFLCAFDNGHLSFLYIEKNYKNILYPEKLTLLISYVNYINHVSYMCYLWYIRYKSYMSILWIALNIVFLRLNSLILFFVDI